MKMRQNEIVYLTYLRAFSCLAVIVLHTFYAASAYATTTSHFAASITVRNLMMWAVPIFVMVSGTLLLESSRNITLKKLFGKYILRMVLALLVFSELFAIYDGIAEKNFGIGMIFNGLRQAVTGTGWNHMWYLYLMIAIYLMLPFYRKISASLQKKDTWYLLIVLFVFQAFLPFLASLIGENIAFYICVYSVYPLYLFVGYSISKKFIALPRWIYLLLIVLSSALIGILSVFSILNQWDTIGNLLENYAFPVIVLQSIGIFGLLMGGTKKIPSWIHKILQQIDFCSFGIYLLHMLFLKLILVTLQWNPYDHGGILANIGLTIFVAFATFLCVWFLKKIPGLRSIL